MASEFSYKGYAILVAAEPDHSPWNLMSARGGAHSAQVALSLNDMILAPRVVTDRGSYFDGREQAIEAGRRFGEQWVNTLLDAAVAGRDAA